MGKYENVPGYRSNSYDTHHLHSDRQLQLRCMANRRRHPGRYPLLYLGHAGEGSLMHAAIARPAGRAAHSAPIGTGVLHCALEDARDRANLSAFCASLNCASSDVSSDGIRLDILRVFDLMRSRGYQVSDPSRAQHQPKPGFTKWFVDITLPGTGPSAKLGFFTSNSH